jgi:hypothetical protein
MTAHLSVLTLVSVNVLLQKLVVVVPPVLLLAIPMLLLAPRFGYIDDLLWVACGTCAVGVTALAC